MEGSSSDMNAKQGSNNMFLGDPEDLLGYMDFLDDDGDDLGLVFEEEGRNNKDPAAQAEESQQKEDGIPGNIEIKKKATPKDSNNAARRRSSAAIREDVEKCPKPPSWHSEADKPRRESMIREMYVL